MIKINDKIKKLARVVIGLIILSLLGLKHFFGIAWLPLQLLGLFLTIVPSLYYIQIKKEQKDVLFYGMLVISLIVNVYWSHKLGLYIAVIDCLSFTLYEIYQRHIKKQI